MRLSHANQAASRQGRADQLRRDRASAQVLRAAFPSVHELRIDLRFDGPFSNTPTSQCHKLYPPARAFFGYQCPFSDCDGHIDLGEAVKAALRSKSNASAGVMACGGSRARDVSKGPCELQIRYQVTATYRDE